MRYISSAEIRSNPAILWKEGEEPESIITVNGKPKVVAFTIYEDQEEIIRLIRRFRAEKALEKIWQISAEKGAGHMTIEEINDEIKAAREEILNE